MATLIGIGSRWKRNDRGFIAGYSGTTYAGRTVIVLDPEEPARVRYQYECDGVIANRTLEAFARDFDYVPAGHDLSNPYLAKPPFITCMSCGMMWDRDRPEPPDCRPVFTGTPMQVLVDRNHAAGIANGEAILESYFRRAAKAYRRSLFLADKFEPGRNGLGAGIVGRWPW